MARNDLENYVYSLNNQLSNLGQFKGNITDDEGFEMKKAVEETIAWLDSNQNNVDKEKYEEQKKKLEGVVHPIFSKLYAGDDDAGSDNEDSQPTGDEEESYKQDDEESYKEEL